MSPLWAHSAGRVARIDGASRESDVLQGPVRVEQTPVLRQEERVSRHVSRQAESRDECLDWKDVRARRHQTGPSTAARVITVVEVSYPAPPSQKGACRK